MSKNSGELSLIPYRPAYRLGDNVNPPSLGYASSTESGSIRAGTVRREGHNVPVLVETPRDFDPETGETVLVNHGLTATATMYTRPSRRLSGLGRRVIRPSFAHTDPAHLHHAIRACAEDIEAITASFRLRNFTLVNHSMATVAGVLAVPYLEHLPNALVQVTPAMIGRSSVNAALHSGDIYAEMEDVMADQDPEWAQMMEDQVRYCSSLGSIARTGAQAYRLKGNVMRRYERLIRSYPKLPILGVVVPGDGITPFRRTKAVLEATPGIDVATLLPEKGRPGHLSFCRDEAMTGDIDLAIKLSVAQKAAGKTLTTAQFDRTLKRLIDEAREEPEQELFLPSQLALRTAS